MKNRINSVVVVVIISILVVIFTVWKVENTIMREKTAAIKGVKQYDLVEHVVSKNDLEVGATIELNDLAIREVPATFVSDQHTSPSEVDSIIGRTIRFPVSKGVPLSQSILEDEPLPRFSDLIPLGFRAITIEVGSVNSISGMLKPGDLVDFYHARLEAGEPTMEILLAGVQIISTGQDIDDGIPLDNDFHTITVQVLENDVNRVLEERAKRSISVALQNSNEPQSEKASVVKMPASIQTTVQSQRKTMIEWIIGGAAGV